MADTSGTNGKTIELKQSQTILKEAEDYVSKLNMAHASEIDFYNELGRIMIQHEEAKMKMSMANQEKLAIKEQENQIYLLTAAFKARDDQRNKEKAEAIKNIKATSEEERKAKEAEIEAEFEARAKADQEFQDKQSKTLKKQQEKNAKKTKSNNLKRIGDKNLSKEERAAYTKELVDRAGGGAKGAAKVAGASFWNGLKESISNLGDKLKGALSDTIAKLDSSIEEQVKLKGSIDTRLQGLNGKHWDDMSKDLIKIAGTSPIVKQADLQQKIADMVEQGIAFNVEQRAVLDVMKTKIATTFEATNATLTRLVRIQQQDTTAGRLGMESALTSFLNNMYETTEYMKTISDGVKSSLEEAMSLMTGENAVSFEYQMQKWLGSLYSVGMSQGSVNSLASTLGKIAAGQLDAISGDGTGNLVIMAANESGLSIADMLANGLDESKTNELMNSMVNYLAKIYSEAGNSKVIQQQFAQVYGLSASDLKAAAQLATSTQAIRSNGLNYQAALTQLNNMASSIWTRTSIGEMVQNAWTNVQDAMARSISSNPALYAVYKGGKLLKDLTGGIDFSIPLVMGSGSAQTFNVADIMMSGALAGGLISNMGNLISSLSNGVDGSAILSKLGIGKGIATVSRGTGTGISSSLNGSSLLSESGSYNGNADSNAAINQIKTTTEEETAATVAAAVENSTETTNTVIDQHIVEIYKLLRDVASGTEVFNVRVENSLNASGTSVWSL